MTGKWLRRAARIFSRKNPKHKLVGHVDTMVQGVVFGWAWRPSAPDERLLVDVFADGIFVGQRLANIFRQDLLLAGIGDGFHGFEIDLNETFFATADCSIEAIAIGEWRTALRSQLARGENRAQDAVCKTPFDYVQTTFRARARGEPLVRVGLNLGRSVSPDVAAEPFYERLLARSPADRSPPALGSPLCAYLDMIRHKWGKADEFDPSLTRGQYAGFLRWYLESYGKTRGGKRAPLSAHDIAFLNSPAASDARLSVAQELLEPHFSAQACNESEDERTFRWAAHETLVFFIDDCLVPERQQNALASVAAEMRDKAYPLSRFMELFLTQNAQLKDLARENEEQRAFIYFVLVMFAATAPHYLKYVPAEWLDAFLAEKAEEQSCFDAHAQRLFGPDGLRCKEWRAAIEALGFDLAAKDFRFRTPKGGRMLSPSLALSRDAAIDIQIIGPFTRTLGVGQSCRMLSRAMQTLGYSVRDCDFSLDHPNYVRSLETQRLARPGRAKINVVHLNLEDLPSAVAYSPDVFTGAYTVAFPYLEMSAPTPSQRLGLSLPDEIWAASQFIADALSSHARVYIVKNACELSRSRGRAQVRRSVYRDVFGEQDFLFLTACDALSGAYRKNPIGAIRAFLHAFPDDANVKLVVKTHSIEKVITASEVAIWKTVREFASQCERIVLIDDILSDEDHQALIEGADCLVSLHRSEGLGYHMLEAMRLGIPVVATAYSGNVDFCTERTAFLADYHMVHVEAGQYPYATAAHTWAEPDHEASVALLRRVYYDCAARERIAEDGRRFVEENYSLEAFARNLDARVRAICAARRFSLASNL